MTPAIAVHELSKSFGSLTAVDHIDFTVEKGELFGFLGPNGAGKTTTVRMLTGIIRPDSGEARVAGYDVNRQPLRVKQLLGIVPEMANAYMDLSVWENVLLMGELYGVPRRIRRERAEHLLQELELWPRRNQRAKALSKGLRQRLLLAMALVNDPEILFLDEPTSGLDVKSAKLIRDKLRDLNQSGKTIFLTTHNLQDAEALCDRVAIIHHGRIVAIDSPARLRQMASEQQLVEVRFREALPAAALGKLPAGVKWEEEKRLLSSRTGDPDQVIKEIVKFAVDQELEIGSINTRGPTLEEIFLQLTAEREGEK